MIYTGIGSRDTPQDIQWIMSRIGYGMAKRGHTLRSGRADGADQAFEKGLFSYNEAVSQKVDTLSHTTPIPELAELYKPWRNFGSKPSVWDILPTDDPKLWSRALQIVRDIHPNPDALTDAAKLLHGRNIFQVLGKDLLTPSDFVIYWAKTDKNGIPVGGTRTAVRLAQLENIPTINMLDPDWNTRFKELVNLTGKKLKMPFEDMTFTQYNPEGKSLLHELRNYNHTKTNEENPRTAFFNAWGSTWDNI